MTFDVFNEEITTEVTRIAQEARRGKGNFEDQIRVVNELLRGFEIIPPRNAAGEHDTASVDALKDTLRHNLESFTSAILEGEHHLWAAPTNQREQSFKYLVDFLMSFASRTGTRERLHIFTTNYDRYIEAGADVAGLRLIDRFVGMLTPVFRASRLDVDLHYNPPGMRGEPRYLEGVARFTKLHGSIDWISSEGTIRRMSLPFGAPEIKPYLSAPGLHNADGAHLMIYPNAAKDRETAAYPYVELFRDLAAAICRPNSTLICYGYSFGDEHINRVIEDMLAIPSTHLVVISYGDPLQRIENTVQKIGRGDQTTVLLGNHLGDLKSLVDNYLPKSAIDRTTIRMADLLKSRWGTSREQDDAKADSHTDADNAAIIGMTEEPAP